MFYRLTVSLFCLTLMSGSAQAQRGSLAAVLVEKPAQAKSFQSIFNGKDLTGWRSFVDPKAKQATDQWHVEEGVLICNAGPKGYLATEKQYEDFVVRFQWKWGNRKPKKHRYSSMFVRVTGPDKIWPKGVDVTLGAGVAGQFWVVDGYQFTVDKKRQDPKNEIHYFAIKADADKPIGQWNQCQITCRGGNIQAKINGHLVNKGTGANPRKGKLILLSEGAEIHFRKIEIRELK